MCWTHFFIRICRMAGPAVSVAKALAKLAPWDGILASDDVVSGQLQLAELWQRTQPMPLAWGGSVQTYLLPVQAAPAYAQHPSAPKAVTVGERSIRQCLQTIMILQQLPTQFPCSYNWLC